MSLDDLKPLKLLVAVDGSQGSVKAIAKAAEMAKEAVAYDIVLVYVVPVKEFPAMIAESDDEAQVRHGKAILDDMLEVANSNGVEARTELLRGHPAQSVLDYASSFQPSMIIVGNRGMNAARSALVGSVSSAISRKARHPVLVVR
ncbi:MAG: Universal stress protein family protein [Methanomassiliicoccales archaeon PtaU1.Bin124]|nr:MAG: Universal stress protein family protein [Methanomassiliicoccales archaeon PtaU1.Bin124]